MGGIAGRGIRGRGGEGGGKDSKEGCGGRRTLPAASFDNTSCVTLVPLALPQYTFEVGSTLLLVATLGFLRFYIIDEAILARDVQGYYPELGQMLSTTINVPIQPWGMVGSG